MCVCECRVIASQCLCECYSNSFVVASALVPRHNRLSNYPSHLSVLSIINAAADASLLLFSHIKSGTHSHTECVARGTLHVACCMFLCMCVC